MELLAQTTDWVQVTKDLGFPVAVALGLFVTFLSMLSMTAFALWRIGNWLAPIVQRIAEGHFDTMETIKESSRQTAASVQQTAISIQAIAETQRAIQREMTEQRKLGEKVCDKMSEPSSPLVAIQAAKVEVPQQ